MRLRIAEKIKTANQEIVEGKNHSRVSPADVQNAGEVIPGFDTKTPLQEGLPIVPSTPSMINLVSVP